MIYVRMTDKFMSGWGAARNMTNVMVVQCETREQADAIERAAQDRREMKRVSICSSMPKNRTGVLYSVKSFSDLSGPWLAYYNGERVQA